MMHRKFKYISLGKRTQPQRLHTAFLQCYDIRKRKSWGDLKKISGDVRLTL